MSNTNEFLIDLLALLDKQKSKTQINTDIKNLEQLVRKLKLTATLARGNTKTEINQTIKQIEAQLRQVKIQAKMDHRQLNREINAALRNVSARDIQLNINSNSERLNAQVRRTVSQAREFVSRNPISINIDLKKEKLLNQLATFTNKHTKINESSYWLGEAERLRGVIGSVTNRDELRNATDQFQVFTTGVRATGYTAVSTTDKIKRMIGNVAKVGNYFGLAFVAVNKFRQSLNNLKELDTLLVEISKTSEMTASQLEELGKKSYSIASKYGVLAKNFMTSVQEMSRAGFGSGEATQLAELATLAQSAGALTSDLANDYLIASSAAFGYKGNLEQLNSLLDAQNQVTNKNAVNMSELASATKVAANQLANSNISENEMTALLGTGIATTKETGQVVGRAVKAIVMNLQQIKNTDEGLETTDEDLGKVESRLNSLGIKMKETADGIVRLKNPISILQELSDVYNSLPKDSAERANIIADIGGKYRGNILSSILSNWSTYTKMLGDYENAEGSALREAEKSADSWEGRVAQLQNTWDEFVSSLTNKDAIKGGVSFLDNTIQAFTKLSDTLGAIPVIMTAINGSMTAFNKNFGITQVFNGGKLDVRGNFMGIDITAFKAQKKHFGEASDAMQQWNSALTNGTADINSFNNATVQNNEQLKAYLATTSTDAPASLQGYKAYLNAAGVSTDALRLKTILLNSAITMGLSLGIQAVVTTISSCVTAENRLQEAAKEAGNQFSSTQSDIEGYKAKIEELYTIINNSSSSYEDTYNARQELLSIQDEMIEKFGREAEAVRLVTDAINGQTEALNTLTEQEWQEAKNSFISGSGKSWDKKFADFWANLWSGSTDNFDRLKKDMEDAEITFFMSHLNMRNSGKKDIYDEFAKQVEELFGAEKNKARFLPRDFDDAVGINKGASFTLSGDLDEIYDKMINIQSLAKNMGVDDATLKDLSEQTDLVKQKLDNEADFYNQSIFYEKINNDDGYKKSFEEIEEAYKIYQNTFAGGNEEAIAKAKQSYAEVVQSAISGVEDQSVIDYFNNMYPELKEDVGKWEFEVRFKAALEDDKDGFENDVKRAADSFKTSEDILTFNAQNATDEQIKDYTELEMIAGKYNLTLGELVDKLVQMGVVASQTKLDLLDKLIPGENGDSGVGGFLRNALGGIDPDAASEWVSSLSEEDAMIANSSGFEEALERQKEALNGAALSADNYNAALEEVKSSQNDMGQSPSSFQEAWQSISTTENESLKTLKDDLLSLAEAGQLTKDAFNETNGSGDFLSMLGIEENDTQKINNLISQINKLKSSADQLSSMKKGISGLSENLYNREKEPSTAIDADTLSGMDSVLKEQTAEWEKYVTVLGDASSSMDDVQKATDELATAYVNSNNFLANLTEANKGYYVSQLDAMGVANSAEIVESRLSSQREVSEYKAQALSIATRALSQESANSTNTLYEQSNALLQEANMSDIAKASLADLVAQQTIFNNNGLNVNDKIASLSALASAYLGTAAQASFLNKVQGGLNSNYRIPVKDAWDQTVKDFTSIGTSTIKMSPITTSPKGSGGSSKTPAQETKKDFSETFDWIERRIKKFQAAFDKWLKQAETAVTSGFVNKYYKKAFSAAKSQLSIYGKAYNKYMGKANSVGLDEKYASKVRNGTIDIEEIRAHGTEDEVKKYEELAEKIKKYQDYYDKAQDSMSSFVETAEKLYNLPLDKAAKKVDLFSNNIDLLGKKLDNAVKLKTKNDFIDKQTKEEKKTLNAYTTARKDSRKQLNSAKKELRKNKNLNDDDGITKKERAKIKAAAKKNKEVNLAFFTENSAGYKAAIRYNEALKANKKAINDAATAQQDYNRWLVEASKLKFDNIADFYNKKVQLLGYSMSDLDNKISEIETAGKKVNKSYYESQKKINSQTLEQYKAEKTSLESNIKNIKEGTEEWYDAKDEIQQVKDAISGCVEEAYNLNNAINQLHFDLFENISDSIGRIITEQEFLQGLFAHEKNADTETGNLTSAGLAKLGSLSIGYYSSKENADRDAEEVKELQRMLDSKSLHSDLLGITFNSLDDLKAKLDETYTKWQDDIKETYSLEASIADVMKEKYQAELDMLKELIDAKEEALNAEKDLHDYQKTLNEKTESISTIQKQIAAYSGDTSQEGLAKLQKLQKELSKKEEDLRETEYDRYISDQQDMLDKLYTEYEELITKKMDDFMGLVREGLQTSNSNTFSIYTYLQKIAGENGYTQEIKDLFDIIGADIKDSVSNTVSNIAADRESTSGTQKEPGKNQGLFKPAASVNKEKPPVIPGERTQKQDEQDIAESFIKNHVNKASKKKSKYSDINKAIYENKGKLYEGKGKVLSSNELKTLARKLLVEYDGDNSKKGVLYKKLKSLKIPGFKKGGVVSIDDIEKQVKDNGDDGIVSIKNGEGILTKPETEAVQKLADHAEKQDEADKTVIINGVECVPVPQEDCLKSLIARSHPEMEPEDIKVDGVLNAIKDFTSGISNIEPPIQPYTKYITNNNTNNNVVNIDMGGITMNGVNDPKEFSKNLMHSIKTYPKVQKVVRSISTDIVAENGKISVNNIT